MTSENIKMINQAQRTKLRLAVKDVVASMRITLKEGDRAPITSPKALKVCERGVLALIKSGGRPLALQISNREAATFLGEDMDPESRYAIAFAFDENANPYCTLPVGAYRLPDFSGPALSEYDLIRSAESAAYWELFKNHAGTRPHTPSLSPLLEGDSR